ncbi:hypothetical protein IQ283_08310 (plasmid) [Alkalihalobacillus hwajinpoensis]|uniref:hypothetical protein n=1 Tax=Guptibacillus hwajinpoensis TaxID=208199 RepID=UPI001883A19D|nr:hypothetical protein [Pseudalkalibacillus hwajinpoensis]MBF0706612.1 hypothetical protein [Pseudalkalibacillus hwajinpoensis]
MGFDQLNLFEEVNEKTVEVAPIPDDSPLYKLQEMIEVRQPEPSLDPEDFHYISSFAGKKGTIKSVKILPNGKICYEVGFPNQTLGIFYEEDVKKYIE